MTPEQIEELAKEIIGGLNGAIGMVGLIDPKIIPFIVIGQAVSNIVPGVAKTVARWVEGNPPTPEELEEFRRKLSVLADPNNP